MPKLNAPDVKREITQKRVKEGDERLALLSGFVRGCLSVIWRGGGALELCLDCQLSFVRDYISALMMAQFKVKPTVEKNSLIFADCEKLLRAMSITEANSRFELRGIDASFRENAPFYVRGMFLGCGSLSVPSAEDALSHKSGGYHLDFSFSSEMLADELIAFLGEQGITAHKSVRAERYVVYVKDGESVSDCLALMGAERAVLELNNAMAAFSVKSSAVRRTNCDIANINRTAQAAVTLLAAIDFIDEKQGLDTLGKKLESAALARREDPQAPLSVVAERLGISKSGLKHRFDNIIAAAVKNGFSVEDNR